MKGKIQSSASVLRNLCVSLVASISAAFFSNFLTFAWELNLYKVDFIEKWPTFILNLLYPLITLSVAILIYSYYDNLDLFNKREYYEGNGDSPLLARLQYLIAFAVSMVFSGLVFRYGYQAFLQAYFDVSIWIVRLLSVITMALLRIIGLWSLKNKWDNERALPFFTEKPLFKRNSDPYRFKPYQMILQPLGYTAIFWLFSWLCYQYIFAMIPAFLIVLMTFWYVALLILLGITLIGYTIRIIYDLRHRRTLLLKLKQMESEGLAAVKLKGCKWVNSFIPTLPFTVEITDANGDRYNGIVATCGKISAPMYFKPDEYIVEHGFHLRNGLLSKGGSFGQVVDVGQLGGKENPTNLIFGYRTVHRLNFPESQGKRIVILNPTPVSVYAIEGRESKPIDTGEDMKNYTIYTATGLFNHIERKNRKNRFDD